MSRFVIDSGTFLPAQKKFWNLPTYIRCLVGGYGSGKTYIGAIRLIYLSYVNSGIPVMYVSPSYKMARRTIIPTLKDILGRAGLTFTHNKSENEIRIMNWNGVIWIGSGDDPHSLLGQSLAAVGIDEPFIQSKDVFDVALSRVRHPDAKQREIFLTGTPESLNWGYDLIANQEQSYDVGVAFASTLENNYLPEQYKESLVSGYTEEMVDAYIHGKFVNLQEGRVYKEFSRDVHIYEREDIEELKKYHQVHIGMDFNVNPMTAVAFCKIGDTCHVFDEFFMANSTTFDMAEVIKEKYPNAIIYPDATGAARKTSSQKSDHQILKEKGLRVYAKRKNPPVRDRVNAVNQLLRVNDKVSKFSMENCPKLINDLERVVWRKGDIDKTQLKLSHISDAFGYGVHYLFPVIKREAYSVTW
ncbi:MAG: phage terminase large subunit [Candidatus Bathyarchaeota archaeon]|nr:phage terminase large subunit [Candidatus Bathyarchaeota archaeon]